MPTQYKQCDGCGCDHPGQLVRMDDGTEKALCFTCWKPISQTCTVLDWINKYGRLQHGADPIPKKGSA